VHLNIKNLNQTRANSVTLENYKLFFALQTWNFDFINTAIGFALQLKEYCTYLKMLNFLNT